MTQECIQNDTRASAVTTQEGQNGSNAHGACQTEAHVYTVRPASEVLEASNDVTIYVELPGVAQDSLEVAVENGMLEIAGLDSRSLPEGFRSAGTPVFKRRFYRQFKLAETLDHSQIQATFTNGLLTLVIAKKPENRRQRIAIGTSA